MDNSRLFIFDQMSRNSGLEALCDTVSAVAAPREYVVL